VSQPVRHISYLFTFIALLLSACANTEAAPTAEFKPQITFATAQPTPTTQAQATATLEAAPIAAPSRPTQAPATLAANANPFTGLPVDEAVLSRRPLLIKLANTPEVRPQTGLQAADVVVEHYAEGGITRFTALYLTHAPEKVGSVRSCRLIDKELPIIFDTALVCSGMSGGVKEIIRNSPVHQNGYTMISDFGECESPGVPREGGCPLFRDPPDFSYAPHNLWANAPNGWAKLTEKDKNQPSTFHAWAFNEAAPPQGIAVTSVTFAYKYGLIGWGYDAKSKLWARSLAGQPFADKATGKAITTANVIAIEVPHITTLIKEDATGARSIEIQLWGEGPAKFFRDGKLIFGKWQRTSEPGVLSFFDGDGKPFALKPGNTWLQLVPADLVIEAK
jgi:hypothetical protein